MTVDTRKRKRKNIYRIWGKTTMKSSRVYHIIGYIGFNHNVKKCLGSVELYRAKLTDIYLFCITLFRVSHAGIIFSLITLS